MKIIKKLIVIERSDFLFMMAVGHIEIHHFVSNKEQKASQFDWLWKLYSR